MSRCLKKGCRNFTAQGFRFCRRNDCGTSHLEGMGKHGPVSEDDAECAGGCEEHYLYCQCVESGEE